MALYPYRHRKIDHLAIGLVYPKQCGGKHRHVLDPFTTIAPFNTANAAPGTAPNPKDGDFVALRTGTGAYAEADGVNLRALQKLIGNGIAFNTASRPTPTALRPTRRSPVPPALRQASPERGQRRDLAANNTVRGLNVGNSSGFKINGAAVGSPIINTVNLTGTGRRLEHFNERRVWRERYLRHV